LPRNIVGIVVNQIYHSDKPLPDFFVYFHYLFPHKITPYLRKNQLFPSNICSSPNNCVILQAILNIEKYPAWI